MTILTILFLHSPFISILSCYDICFKLQKTFYLYVQNLKTLIFAEVLLQLLARSFSAGTHTLYLMFRPPSPFKRLTTTVVFLLNACIWKRSPEYRYLKAINIVLPTAKTEAFENADVTNTMCACVNDSSDVFKRLSVKGKNSY